MVLPATNALFSALPLKRGRILLKHFCKISVLWIFVRSILLYETSSKFDWLVRYAEDFHLVSWADLLVDCVLYSSFLVSCVPILEFMIGILYASVSFYSTEAKNLHTGIIGIRHRNHRNPVCQSLHSERCLLDVMSGRYWSNVSWLA
jgi:hypothetical protein